MACTTHTELHATNDKKYMDVESEERPDGFWPVFKGESFDIWEPDTSRYYAWADPEVMLTHLLQRRERCGRNRRSPFSEFELPWLRKLNTLPCHFARIADDLPADMAENHDHYIHGTPKQP